MLPCLFLAAALWPGQTEPAAEPPALLAQPVTEAPTTPSATPAPDRWLLMKALQGTWAGSLLTDSRLQISGWIDASFTGSSAADANLPLGFNYRANQFLLQQNWVRFERPVATDGSGPSFGRSPLAPFGTYNGFTIHLPMD
jgi:hypothetical protein